MMPAIRAVIWPSHRSWLGAGFAPAADRLDQLLTEAVNFKYLPKPLTPDELAELVQVPLR